MKLYTFDSKTLTYKRIFFLKRTLKVTLVFLFLFLMLGISSSPPKIKYITNTEKILLVEEVNKFNENKLIQSIEELNFKYPHIILAQSILETGHYNSKIFKENNNLFGMKEARIRLNLAKGTQHGHAYYSNWEESLMDYALWYSNYASKCKSEEQLFKLLDKQYAEANYYVKSLKNIIERDSLKLKFKIK